jgi:Peptidase family M28
MYLRATLRFVAGAAALAVAATAASAQSKPLPLKHKAEPTTAAITATDLMTHLYIIADDSMMGRQAGTEYNTKGTDYIASQLKKFGVTPGGENGTYFQNVGIIDVMVSSSKPLTIDGRQFLATKDFIPRQAHPFNGEQVIFGGTFGDSSWITPEQAAGKIVVLATPLRPDGKPTWFNMRQPISFRYQRSAGIAVVGMDGMSEADWKPLLDIGQLLDNPGSEPMDFGAPFGFMYVTKAMANAMMGAPIDGMKPGTLGRTVAGAPAFDSVRAVPGRNVIGIVEGSDPKLRGEYVALGAHNDHIGFQSIAVDHDSLKLFNAIALPEGADSLPRTMTTEMIVALRTALQKLRETNPPRKDSIYNGADDDGSGTVSVLEIAEYFAKNPVKPKRSLLFVWHTGEELGLFGSTYFTDHPIVPRDSIVAQLNLDMVGRGGAADVTGKTKWIVDNGRIVGGGEEIHGGPDYLQLVGSRRLSTELGDLIETVNKTEKRPLKFDYSIDADGHQSNIYCRSDHYSYARYGIPITFFTTGGHADYHQLTDEAEYIDYEHMARVANLVKDIATSVANLDHRIVVDKPKPDPKGQCRQ